ncbi:MAG TPA: prolyl oligopeptidase family serine peptidase [Puia sp.]|nr:prolyl oligopeptidase family serine peptidase [Puia sp.]
MKHPYFPAALAAITLLAGCRSNEAKQAAISYPPAATVDSADVYFGTRVPDPYRWLENDSSPATEAWISAERKTTNDYLAKIPFRGQIKKELTSLLNYARMTAPEKHGGYYYFYKNSGLQNQDVLYRNKNLADSTGTQMFLDPNSFSHGGAVTMQGTSFSPDGSLMAYLLSNGGSDWRDVVVKSTASGNIVGDTIRNVKFSGVSWRGNEGFYYSTYDVPKGENRLVYKTIHHTVYYHKMGEPQSSDQFIFGGERQPHRYIDAGVTEDQHYLVIDAAETTYGNELYIKDLTRSNAPIKPITSGYNFVENVFDSKDGSLYIYTNRNAPNFRLVKVSAENPGPDNWKDVIPETGNVLQLSKAGGYLFATYMVDVKNKVFQYDYDGNRIREIGLPTAGTAGGFDALRGERELYYVFTSFTYPSTIYHLDLQTGQSALFWRPAVNFNPDEYVTQQVFYASKDSTKVPMYIVYKKGMAMDGRNPTLLYGYGGFDISLTPYFSSLRMEWLEHGGIYAQPNLRGGGEYGEKWHMAGTLMHKQNVFDDFIAAAEYLEAHNYTSSSYLAVEGGSNGGLLIGATMTQRPDLMRVALPEVGVLDMLRYNRFTAGAGWASDYGTAEDSPAMFRYLLGYSPLQNLKKGTHYPATLVWTADHDDRVVPGHSFKFAATLQKDNAGDNPVLIEIQHNAGHGTGMDTEKLLDEYADKYAFIWYNMGINPLSP